MANSNEYDYNYGINDTPGNGTAAKREVVRQKQAITLVTIGALVAILFLSLFILLIGSACNAAGGNEKETGTTPDEKITWGKYTITAASDKTGSLVLANATHAYTIPETDESLTSVIGFWYPDRVNKRYKIASNLFKYMNAEALTQLDRFLNDCGAATGETGLLLRFAYLSDEEQQSVKTVGDDFKTGLGAEILLIRERDGEKFTYDFSINPDVSAWLNDNAAKYGFVVRYPDDKGEATGVTKSYTKYFRYVGVAHATYMKENGLCLEEYIEKLRTGEYTSKKPLTITGANGRFYNVYCVPVVGNTEIDVPTNYAYTVSGTNDGFVVVTVDRSSILYPVQEPDGSTTDTTPDTTVDTTNSTTASN